MAKKCEFSVQPNDKQRGGGGAGVNLNNNNVEGIFLALRYLSLEAEGAGLIELANTLEEAALKWDRSTTKIANNSTSFNKSRAARVEAASHKSRQGPASGQEARYKTERA
jgi:hypothetical protein